MIEPPKHPALLEGGVQADGLVRFAKELDSGNVALTRTAGIKTLSRGTTWARRAMNRPKLRRPVAKS